MPVEGPGDDIQVLATQMPVEGPGDDIQALVTQMPIEGPGDDIQGPENRICGKWKNGSTSDSNKDTWKFITKEQGADSGWKH